MRRALPAPSRRTGGPVDRGRCWLLAALSLLACSDSRGATPDGDAGRRDAATAEDAGSADVSGLPIPRGGVDEPAVLGAYGERVFSLRVNADGSRLYALSSGFENAGVCRGAGQCPLGQAELHVVDVSTPGAPTRIDCLRLCERVLGIDVAADESVVFVERQSPSGVSLLSLDADTRFDVVGEARRRADVLESGLPGDEVTRVALPPAGDVALAYSDWTVEAFDLGSSGSPAHLGTYLPPAECPPVPRTGDCCPVTDSTDHCFVYSVAFSREPSVAFVREQYGTAVIDLQAPERPARLQGVDRLEVLEQGLSAGRAYGLVWESRFVVYDVGADWSLQEAGVFDTRFRMEEILPVSDRYLYLAGESGLWLMDVEDPGAPELLRIAPDRTLRDAHARTRDGRSLLFYIGHDERVHVLEEAVLP